MKKCSKCNTIKPASDFYTSNINKSGLRSHCKPCFAVYRKKTAARRADYDRNYNIVNAAAISEKRRLYREKNAEILKAKKRKQYFNDAERIKERVKNYQLANPDKVYFRDMNRRSLKRGAEGTYKKSDILFIFNSQRGLCAGCKNKLFKSGKLKYHVDHIMPLKLGGSNWPHNLQCLCPPCNYHKSAKPPEVWAKELGRLL